MSKHEVDIKWKNLSAYLISQSSALLWFEMLYSHSPVITQWQKKACRSGTVREVILTSVAVTGDGTQLACGAALRRTVQLVASGVQWSKHIFIISFSKISLTLTSLFLSVSLSSISVWVLFIWACLRSFPLTLHLTTVTRNFMQLIVNAHFHHNGALWAFFGCKRPTIADRRLCIASAFHFPSFFN